MKGVNYKEGSVFSIPLEKNCFSVGVVARVAPQGGVLLAYFFGELYRSLPSLMDVENLKASDASKCWLIGDLALLNCDWPILGGLKEWERVHWPVPVFVREEVISHRAWLVYLSDSNPAAVEREVLVKEKPIDMGNWSVLGYGFVQFKLKKLFCEKFSAQS
ncbi:Imm26 family immunity protein [uncultured Xanthomonas sp.]|uniref:Imm26 family immunity protein n=1 Tax=uncultured Xanthomonas sp. TaxID=152831 RepID=UPI0025DC09C5|nr:Imm26 family immunity protein [uncultured Xanthomonas sp.]